MSLALRSKLKCNLVELPWEELSKKEKLLALLSHLMMSKKRKRYPTLKFVATDIQFLVPKVKSQVSLRSKFRVTEKVSQNSPRRAKGKSVSYVWKTLRRRRNLIAAIMPFAMPA